MRQYLIDTHYRGASGRFLETIKRAIEYIGGDFFHIDADNLHDVTHVNQIKPKWKRIEEVFESGEHPSLLLLLVVTTFLDTAVPDGDHAALIRLTRSLDYNALHIITALMLNDTVGRQRGQPTDTSDNGYSWSSPVENE